MKSLKLKTYEEWLRELGRAEPGKKEAQGGPPCSLELPNRRGHQQGGQALLPGNKGQDKGK